MLRINREIRKAQDTCKEIDTKARHGTIMPSFSFWSPEATRERIDLMLEQRDAVIHEIATLKTGNCSIL